MGEPALEFTPVNLITGCLGSGKTTLLQRLLRDPALSDTAVLINEFGEVGLDHHLVERIDDTMVLLQSGCICCTIRGELSDAIKDLHEKRERGLMPEFRRLVIESTGLADPFPILSTVHADPVLKHHYRLGNVITTVDAVNGCAQLDDRPESVKQIAVADRIAVTKTDIADATTTRQIVERVRRLNPSADLWTCATEAIDAEALIGHDLFDLTAKTEAARRWFSEDLEAAGQADHEHRHAHHDRSRHDDDIHAFTITFDAPLDWAMFALWLSMLLNCHGTAVLRVKGILNVSGSAAPVAIHGVQHLVHSPVHMRAWPDADRRSRLVFIVKGLDAARIRLSLQAFAGLSASNREATADPAAGDARRGISPHRQAIGAS